MKPPQSSSLALYMLHYYVDGLASVDDVLAAARQLDEVELERFKMIGKISYFGRALQKVLPVIERL